MKNNPYNHIKFVGKQDDEVILYVIRPHFFLLLARLTVVLIRIAIIFLLWNRANMIVSEALAPYELPVYILIVFFGLIDIAWQVRYYLIFRGYVTDRRIVVVKSLFPVTVQRMTLFWKDAAKARDIAPNFIWRMLKVGKLEISAQLFQGAFEMIDKKINPLGSEIQINFVKHFVEVTNYIDTLIHLHSDAPEKIKELQPLIFDKKTELVLPEINETLKQKEINTN